MDYTDRAILSALQANSGLTHAALGEKIGLSASACHRRVKALEERGVIERYVAILSESALGNRSVVFIAATLDNQRRETLDAFEKAIAACAEVLEAYLMSGEFDYLLRVSVAEGDSYERIHKDVLSGLPGVRRLVSNFAIKQVARRTVEPLPRLKT
jgi:Lrp/AsnC family transcriptional regulator, leucine-responsive regulatory protein